MNLLIVGINHKTALLPLREKLAFTPERLEEALNHLLAQTGLAEAAILSTCNRTEIIAISARHESDPIKTWLADYQQLDMHDLAPALYVKTGKDALRHSLRVACGLDSMVTGEPEILGQFKHCFEQAKQFGTLGPELEHLSQTAFRIAKQVRTDTAIGESSVSMAAIAVTLAQQLFTDLGQCRVLLIGAGDTIRSLSRHLHQAGVRGITIANRTLWKAKQLVQDIKKQDIKKQAVEDSVIKNSIIKTSIIKTKAIDLQSLHEALKSADIVITSTASPLPLLGKGALERALRSRKHQPMLMVDLAVPRDIEPEVARLKDVYLYSIDDLQDIIQHNKHHRQEAAEAAEAIVLAAAKHFKSRQETQKEHQTLVQFRQLHEEIKQQALQQALARLDRGEAPAEVLRKLANQLVNKIMHPPSVALKTAAADKQQALLDVIARIYQLNEAEDGE